MMMYAHSIAPSGFLAPFTYPASPTEADFTMVAVRFLQDGVARIASPLLGLISGYLALMTYRKSGAVRFIAKRFRRLYVPAVIWSVAFVAVMELTGLILGDAGYARAIIGPLMVGTFLGLDGWPANSPLHYLIDLFKCALLLPVVLAINRIAGMRVAGIGVMAAAVFLVLSDLNSWHPGLNQATFLPRSDLFLFFFAGVYIAYRGHDISQLAQRTVLATPRAAAVGAFLVFVGTALSWQYVASIGTTASSLSAYGILIATRIIGAGLAIYVLVTLKLKARFSMPAGNDRLTFAVFCSHAIIFQVNAAFIPAQIASQTFIFFISPILAVAYVAAFMALASALKIIK